MLSINTDILVSRFPLNLDQRSFTNAMKTLSLKKMYY